MTKPDSTPLITKIELTPLHVPFGQIVIDALKMGDGKGMAIPSDEGWEGGDFVICRLTAEDGSTGLGEICIWTVETGIVPQQAIILIEQWLGRFVLGENPFAVERIRHRMDANTARNDVIKGLIDMACYDLMGKISGRRACDFFGGPVIEEIPLGALIPMADVKTMIDIGRMVWARGFRTIRLKLGAGVRADREIVAAFREEFGHDFRLRVDYNQAYSPPDAVRAIQTIEPYGIDFAEQPVWGADYQGMVYVQERVNVPLMSHEGCFSLQDVVTLVETGAVGVVGLNTERPGGITSMLRAISYAEQKGLGSVIHNQGLGIGNAVLLHVAAARHHSLGHATELFGHIMMDEDLIISPIEYTDRGTAILPGGLGLGVELDVGALDKFATGKTVTLKA